MALIEPEEWKKVRERCRVARFWGTDEHELGHLIRKPGGSWAFHYDIHGDPDDDASGYRFGDERFIGLDNSRCLCPSGHGALSGMVDY